MSTAEVLLQENVGSSGAGNVVIGLGGFTHATVIVTSLSGASVTFSAATLEAPETAYGDGWGGFGAPAWSNIWTAGSALTAGNSLAEVLAVPSPQGPVASELQVAWNATGTYALTIVGSS